MAWSAPPPPKGKQKKRIWACLPGPCILGLQPRPNSFHFRPVLRCPALSPLPYTLSALVGIVGCRASPVVLAVALCQPTADLVVLSSVRILWLLCLLLPHIVLQRFTISPSLSTQETARRQGCYHQRRDASSSKGAIMPAGFAAQGSYCCPGTAQQFRGAIAGAGRPAAR